MPTEIEIKVIKALSAIEVPPTLALTIEGWGNEAVTVLCEAALGTYPGLRQKIRTNAVALLGWMTHPQAMETVRMLINDSNEDIAIRAMRSSGRQKNDGTTDQLQALLSKSETSPLLAAEAVQSLINNGSVKARAVLTQYAGQSPETLPHRRNALVQELLNKMQH
ncbi:HEAT repeat domain-containing protein [Flavihumibacter petaseus]|uniref:HEAT repeat domain-containing protein n=1 Tax=Flavihumibacter petaseus NBRC 106054 TaxID=1220578 RepID=A0A0E9N664_9BACT|nr:HEAT repeat domain-containing protein [Flavihumibacter petaseus]GAO45412.1 hypothetical protein FPE01S_05_01070 [Flavihumibacter petaseus NBRC 106054]